MRASVSSNLLQVDKLTKRYGNFAALDGCSLTIPEGSIFGLLGPNGAGKTTLIRCLLGYLRPTSGDAWVRGLSCRTQSLEIRRIVGYLPAESKLFRLMRGEECLDFFTSIHPRGDRGLAMRVANRLGLDLRRRVAFMSTGMRQKLAICCVMSCPSPLMILDEPTANLDPTVRNIVLELVREARDQGSTIAFCSHILSEIEELCDDVAILRNGQVVHAGRLQEVRQIHRLTARTPNPIDHLELPVGAEVIEHTDDHLAIDLPGAFDQYLPWITDHRLHSIQIEMVGLRKLYESHHQGTEERVREVLDTVPHMASVSE